PLFFFFQAEDGIRDFHVTGVQTCALPILYCQPGPDANAVSQYDKDDVEAAGLVKFDFLGLRNLTILDWAVRYVRQFNPSKRDFRSEERRVGKRGELRGRRSV